MEEAERLSPFAAPTSAPSYFLLQRNESSGAVLRLSPPSDVQASAGLVIDGPVVASGVAVAPLAERVAALETTLPLRVTDLEYRLGRNNGYACGYEASSLPVSVSGASTWLGSVRGADGKLYGIPHDASAVLVVDPALKTVKQLQGAGDGPRKWIGGVSAANGLIYGIPFHAAAVLIVNPWLQTWDVTAMREVSGDAAKWVGGVEAPPTGLIYAIPHFSADILVIDPEKNYTATMPSGAGPGVALWFGGVYSSLSERVYGIPCTAPNLLVIEPRTNSTAFIAVPGSAPTCSWAGAVVGRNGIIYGIPHAATAVLLFNPLSNISDVTLLGGLAQSSGKWHFGALSLSTGLIYGSPSDADGVLAIDPSTGTMRLELVGGLGVSSGNWAGCEIVQDVMFCIPNAANRVLVVEKVCSVYRAKL